MRIKSLIAVLFISSLVLGGCVARVPETDELPSASTPTPGTAGEHRYLWSVGSSYYHHKDYATWMLPQGYQEITDGAYGADGETLIMRAGTKLWEMDRYYNILWSLDPIGDKLILVLVTPPWERE